MSTTQRPPDFAAIHDLVEQTGAALASLGDQDGVASQALLSLAHKRDRVTNKLEALDRVPPGRQARLLRELEEARLELEQTWARVRLGRLLESVR